MAKDVINLKALQQYRIRDCAVRLDRLKGGIVKPFCKKKNLLTPDINTVRSNESMWITAPASEFNRENATKALAGLIEYQHQNGIEPPQKNRKNVRRERAKSMYLERPLQDDDNTANRKNTLDDMHLELAERYSRSNRGLTPSSERQLAEPQPKPISEFQRIYNEFLEKLAAKK